MLAGAFLRHGFSRRMSLRSVPAPPYNGSMACDDTQLAKLMRRTAFLVAASTFASCVRSSPGADVHASSVAATRANATHSNETGYIAISSCRAYSVLGFVPGSGALRDGELKAADDNIREMLPLGQPVIVVGFGDNAKTAGDADADRRLAVSRASFVTDRLEAMGVRVARPTVLPSRAESEITSAVIYWGCHA